MSTIRSKPVEGFDHLCSSPALLRGLSEAGFTNPRPIQAETIPAAREGRDILGLAETGSGKTAAFALPTLECLLNSPRRGGPSVLIVAPTRELAAQIDQEIKRLARFTQVKTVTVFGGVALGPQVAKLRKSPDVVVACPGRLLDLHGQGALPLDEVRTLILDEADHMFDMGFLPDIRRILGALPAKRQNLLFSATMPAAIRRLAKGILNDPHLVDLNHSRPVSTIEHAIYPVKESSKLPLLQHLCSQPEFVSAIVFTRTKHRAKRLARRLEREGHRAVALQGNMSQSQRVKAMDGFRRGRFDILVATDIAARGIDVQQVSHVVNFDMPGTVDAYTHRIGRTGRSEREGKAYTFVTGGDRQLVAAVERRIGTSIPSRTMPDLIPIVVSGTRERRAPGPRSEKPWNRRGKAVSTPARRRRSRRSNFRKAS